MKQFLKKELKKLNISIKNIEKISPDISVILKVEDYCCIIKILQKSKKRLENKIKKGE